MTEQEQAITDALRARMMAKVAAMPAREMMTDITACVERAAREVRAEVEAEFYAAMAAEAMLEEG